MILEQDKPLAEQGRSMHFVIIGGDAAGMSAASRAKRTRPEMDVTVLEMSNDVSYSACGMPYNIADSARDVEDLVVRRAEVFREKQGINLLTGHRVLAIDPSHRNVSGVRSDGSEFAVGYDKLLIASGASAVVPPIPGLDHPAVFFLKNLNDARIIKNRLVDNSVQKVVIIGMGYVALEMVEAFYERGIAADMVEILPDLLPWMPGDLTTVIRDEIENGKIIS